MQAQNPQQKNLPWSKFSGYSTSPRVVEALLSRALRSLPLRERSPRDSKGNGGWLPGSTKNFGDTNTFAKGVCAGSPY